MNLSHLRYFVELAHTRHYTRAAEHLFITQPSLSHAIGQLESELGVPLFERSGRNTTLTTSPSAPGSLSSCWTAFWRGATTWSFPLCLRRSWG